MRRRKWRGARWWILAALLIAFALVLRGWSATPDDPIALPASFTICGEGASAACVIDGDTVAIGTVAGRRAWRIRFTGFDAPELDGACEAEREAALTARRAAHEWLNAAPAFVDGGADPPRDRYGRELRSAARTNGETLADHMLERGLAQGSGWGAPAIDWCANRR